MKGAVMRQEDLVSSLETRDKQAIAALPVLLGVGGLSAFVLGAAIKDYIKTQQRNKGRIQTFNVDRTMPLLEEDGTEKVALSLPGWLYPWAVGAQTTGLLALPAIHLGALGLYALLRKGNKEKIDAMVNKHLNKKLDKEKLEARMLDEDLPKVADAAGLGAMAAETALAKSVAKREGRGVNIPTDALVPGVVTAGTLPYLMAKGMQVPSDQELDDMDKEWLWNFFPIIGALRYFRRMKRINNDAERLRREREARVRAEQTQAGE
jgi:hypothetical protein